MSAARPKGRDAAVHRYGSQRAFLLRLLYSWLTLSILYLFPWPLLVIYAGAPAVSIEETPAGWFQLRLLAPALTALLVVWLWRQSPVPVDTIVRKRTLSLFAEGRVWPQVLVILLGSIAALTGFLLFENPTGAVKLFTLTLAEALVIQILNSGYLHGALGLVFDRLQATLAATGLYALTFGIRAALASVSEASVGEGAFLIALVAGLVAGAAIGGISGWLRNRSHSLLPGALTLWLTLIVLGLGEFYDP